MILNMLMLHITDHSTYNLKAMLVLGFVSAFLFLEVQICKVTGFLFACHQPLHKTPIIVPI